jgi:hypothetical protein
MRAPRTPWVNPARRLHLVAAAVVGALIFAGGGVLIGQAVSDDGHHRNAPVRFERGGPRMMDPRLQQWQFGKCAVVPDRPAGPRPAPSGSATR